MENVERFFESIKNMFSGAGVQNWRENLSGSGGMAEWYDPNSDGEYALIVDGDEWNLLANEFKERGSLFEPDAVRKAYERIRIQLFDERGGEEPVSNVTDSSSNDSSREIGLTLMSERDLQVGRSNSAGIPLPKKEADYGLAPLHRDYLSDEYEMKPGDSQIILIAEGANEIYEVFKGFRKSRISLKSVQYERIEELRYAGSDNHIDRGKIRFKVRVMAGPFPYRKAGFSVVVKVKDGEIISPLKFMDVTMKERMLSDESIFKYLGLQENTKGRYRGINDTEKAEIDRTLYPPVRSRSLFHGDPGVDSGSDWRNIGFGDN